MKRHQFSNSKSIRNSLFGHKPRSKQNQAVFKLIGLLYKNKLFLKLQFLFDIFPTLNQQNSSNGNNRIYPSKINLIGWCLVPIAPLYLCATAMAQTVAPTISVVQSQENTNQWTGIGNRLQAAGVNYCVIPLNGVTNAADWGDRQILLLPNVENISPAQAIALEEWVSRGGRVIASGPVGSSSAPGVRQLLRGLLGGYWGFALNGPQKLQPASNEVQRWAKQNQLVGEVRGGVVVPDNFSTQTAAVWGSQNSAAVVATERSTFLGWRWGVDAASSQLDAAWLQAALSRHTQGEGVRKVPGGNSNCSTTVQTAASFTPPTVAAKPPSIPNFNLSPAEAIDQLQENVRLDVSPNSNKPIGRNEAIALQQELQNLIGRVESAHLAASVISNTPPTAKIQTAQFASTQPGALALNTEQALDRAREIAKNLPQLIAQKNYVQARRQWLQAKATLWQQFPTDRQMAQPEIRAMWLDRGTIVAARNEQGLSLIFDRMAQAGINTVLFETVNSSYTIYPSQVAPQQNPMTRNWDPLASAVKLAHARNMEIHAWVWAFAAGNRRHNEILNLDPNYPGPVLAAHPDWAGYDNEGRTIPPGQGKPFLDPANPDVRRYLLNLYDEIVTKYQVDGLHLDYIRYPFQDPERNRTYGYGQAARKQFQQRYGVDPMKISPSQTNLWQQWTTFRTQQIDTFVAQVSQQLRRKNPDLTLSVAVFPLPEFERIQKLQQHWEVWARRGDVDLIVPMTYALDTPRFQGLVQPWIASRQLGSTLLVPGIRLLNLPTMGTFDQIQLVRDLPVSGYALFAAENLNNDLYKVFSITQPRSSEPTPLRQPFKTAANRYKALLSEWQIISQYNLGMTSTNAAQFKAQADVLQQALDRLASSPSTSQLQTAKGSLSRFQSQFKTLMRQHALQNPYQVKVWENRLATIESLLQYGQAKLRSIEKEI